MAWSSHDFQLSRFELYILYHIDMSVQSLSTYFVCCNRTVESYEIVADFH